MILNALTVSICFVLVVACMTIWRMTPTKRPVAPRTPPQVWIAITHTQLAVLRASANPRIAAFEVAVGRGVTPHDGFKIFMGVVSGHAYLRIEGAHL